MPPRVTVHGVVPTKRTFCCSACGATASTIIHGLGSGEQAAPMVTDDAVADARSEAMADAERDADLALSLAACPKCGAHDASARRRFWATHLPAVVIAAGLPWSIVAGEVVLYGTTGGLGILGPLGLLLSLGAAGRIWATWSTAPQRVAFLTDPRS